MKSADTNLLVLVNGVDSNRKNFHAYVALPAFKLSLLRDIAKKGSYNLGDFGHILYVGEGLIPPKNLAEDLMIEHGYEHNLSEVVNDLFSDLGL